MAFALQNGFRRSRVIVKSYAVSCGFYGSRFILRQSAITPPGTGCKQRHSSDLAGSSKLSPFVEEIEGPRISSGNRPSFGIGAFHDQMDTRVRVLLVCSRSFLGAYLRLVIEGRPRFRVIEEVISPAVAIATVRQKRPRLVLFEYQQSDQDSIMRIRGMTQEEKGACLLVGTAQQATSVAEQAREWGVAAVVVDNDRPKDLIRHLDQMSE